MFLGTTEKIFEEKKELHDLYIDNQNVKTHRSHLLPLLRLNAADKERYRKLSEQRYATLSNIMLKQHRMSSDTDRVNFDSIMHYLMH